MTKPFLLLCLIITISIQKVSSQSTPYLSQPSSGQSLFLRSTTGYQGSYKWQMRRVDENNNNGKEISSAMDHSSSWQPAIVPGTILNSLVANKVYPEPYYGDNNKKSRHLIPDIADIGRAFYHYWFRTEFKIPQSFQDKRIWLKFHGINYHCDIWVNGKNIGKIDGMFNSQRFDVTDIVNRKANNILAIDIQPVDIPGSYYRPGQSRTGAVGENHNGGDGEIGKNVTMLMSVGWDFTAPDGIRDRNTGIWRDVELYTTGNIILEDPFIKTKLPLPDTTSSKQTISVDVINVSSQQQKGILSGDIKENNIHFQKSITLEPNEKRTITFTPEDYKQLTFANPKLWWPINKGKQNLYTLTLKFVDQSQKTSHSLTTPFGIREVTSDQNTPDRSRRFYVNGQPIFIRGTNWVPEAMLRNTEERTYAELRYTRQAGVNLLRLWGGGIAESDYFYQLCDQFGLLVWNEFWLTGDTRFPSDTALYFKNLTSTVKRIRNHPSVAYYVASNESKEIPGTEKLIRQLDPTRGYQEQSECCGIHDGSPYKYENPMQYFENTASKRGSRVDGFNPEYGTPCLPIVESLKKMMPTKDLWPINDSVWNYLDGNGFHQMTTKYNQAVEQFGKSSSIEEYAKKAQFVGATNYRSIWEVWNYNKFNYGDRFASGYLFWYHNSPLPQTASRLYDWYLEPTAALYYSQNGLSPLHPQFDYLKNTVSVYNDYRKAFNNYTVEAVLYDLNSKKISEQQKKIDIPSDGVVNDALKISFPESISQVHFIKLKLKDANGKLISDAFYWRSKDKYQGAWTMTGPAVSGFNAINQLAKITLNVSLTTKQANNKYYIRAVVTNPTTTLSFFTQLKLNDAEGNSIHPAYYSDNFFSLLPGESKVITIEVAAQYIHQQKVYLGVDSWNATGLKRLIK